MEQGQASEYPIAVVGAGPIGLAAAAHLLERNLEPIVLEAGDEVAASVALWGHVRLFSPWRYNIDGAARRLLERDGDWRAPDLDRHPTGADLRNDYLLPLARTAELRGRIRPRSRVLAVARHRRDKMKNDEREGRPFELLISTDRGRERLLASAVIDASGSLLTPNPLGASGLPAEGEEEASDQIAYGIPDVLTAAGRYAGRRTLVVGSGHSAMNVVRDLVELKLAVPSTEIVWAVRRKTIGTLFGGGEADALVERGRLGAEAERLVAEGLATLIRGIEIEALHARDSGIAIAHSGGEIAPVDQIVATTGFRPDLALLSELRLALDPSVEAPAAIAPLIDPNFHSCGSVPPHGARELTHPEADLYIAGMKSYGRAPTFLMLTGYEQVRSIAAALAGDLEAAARVELVLPETGVCKVEHPASTAACCDSRSADTQLVAVASPGAARTAAVVDPGCCG